MNWKEALRDLGEWFPVGCHQKREIKGGGEWYFVPWQDIRDKLDCVLAENWELSYGTPLIDMQANTCAIECRISITLEGQTRTRSAWGSVPISELSRNNKEMTQGSPIDRAQAESFKNAAEAWGLCRYLDWQRSPNNPTPEQDKRRQEWARFMHRGGDSRPATQYRKDNQPSSTGARPNLRAVESTSNPLDRPTNPAVDQFNQKLLGVATLEEGLALTAWANSEPVSSELDSVSGVRSLLLSRLTKRLVDIDDLSSVMVGIEVEMRRIQMSPEDGKELLFLRYKKKGRSQLTIGELLDFWAVLKQAEAQLNITADNIIREALP